MLKAPNMPAQRRGLTAIDGVIALIVILLIVQMWLLSATLSAYLAGHKASVLPAAVVSGLIFAGCAALYWFVEGIDRRARRQMDVPPKLEGGQSSGLTTRALKP